MRILILKIRKNKNSNMESWRIKEQVLVKNKIGKGGSIACVNKSLSMVQNSLPPLLTQELYINKMFVLLLQAETI